MKNRLILIVNDVSPISGFQMRRIGSAREEGPAVHTPFGFYGCSAVASRHDDLASTPHPRNPRPVFHLRRPYRKPTIVKERTCSKKLRNER